MKKEYDCIVCPMSCHLIVEENEQHEIIVKGNSCPRGAMFGKQEWIEPKRMLTTTVRIDNAIYPLLPVISSCTVSKNKIFDIMEACKKVKVKAPVHVNDVIVHHVAGTEVDLIASRTMLVKDMME